MKTESYALAVVLLALFSCDKSKEKSKEKSTPAASVGIVNDELRKADMPILSLKVGDFWKYRVAVDVSPGITKADAPATSLQLVKTRTFRGKVQVSEKHPEAEAFDVEVTGQSLERELVEIYEDRIMMRGTIRPNEIDAKPLWLEPAVPFVFAGLRPGQELTRLGVMGGASKRVTKVVAREKVTVPAGDFNAIRLLITGNDGQFELHKTIWFVPKVGIVKEEKIRYSDGLLIFRETTELTETNVATDAK